MNAANDIWKRREFARKFVDGVRDGVPFAAEQLDAMLRMVEARGAAVERFADLGCGGGVLGRVLLERYPPAQGVMVDFSEAMLDEARKRLADHAARVDLVLADLGEPGWRRRVEERAPFDVVVSGYAIHHLPHERKRALYREIFELLGPGGMFVNVEHVASSTEWIERVSDGLFVDCICDLYRSRGDDKSREQVAAEHDRRPDKAANILAPVEEQCGWLRECGFADVDCYFKVFELAVFGGRRRSE